MLVLFQIHTPAAKRDSFHLEPQSLFCSGFLPQFDFTTGADYSLPWKLRRWRSSEQTSDGAVVPRIARGRRHLSVRGHRSLRNRKDHSSERCVAGPLGTGAVARDRTLRFAGNGPRGLALPHSLPNHIIADDAGTCTVIALLKAFGANGVRIPR